MKLDRREFQFIDGSSKKFWSIALDGTSFTVHFGRIGTLGQAKAKDCGTEDAAKREYDKLIMEKTSAKTPVFGYMHQPANVAFYLGRPVTPLERSDVATRVCSQAASVVYIMQPFGRTPVEVPCLGRLGVEHRRFRQYANAGRIDVWFVPPAR